MYVYDVTNGFLHGKFSRLVVIVVVKITRHYNHKIFNTVFYIEVFYPGSNRYKINETLREQ